MLIHRPLRVTGLRRGLLAACVVAGLGVDVASAAAPAPVVLTVTNCGDSGPGSLRDAVATATADTTIDLSGLSCPDSKIQLESAITVGVANLTIQGRNRDALTIDGGDADVVFSSPFNFTIRDLTIAHGSTDTGYGGCLFIGGNLTLTRSLVTSCRAGDGHQPSAYGAGVDVLGNLTMESSTISGSTADALGNAFGGGAYVTGDVHFIQSTISGNSAIAISNYAAGAGVFARGSVYVDGGRIESNTARSDGPVLGGGVQASGAYIKVYGGGTIAANTAHSNAKSAYGGGINGGIAGTNAATVVLTSATLSHNVVTSDCTSCLVAGGGANVFGRFGASSSTISDNQARSAAISAGNAAGGGVAVRPNGPFGSLGLVNSTVSGNSASGGDDTEATGYGGGIAARFQTSLALANSTIAFNYATDIGGGVIGGAVGADQAQLYSNILANNVAPFGGADLIGDLADTPMSVEGGNNLVMSASAGVTLPSDTLNDDPLLLPLTNNGGLTMTHGLAPCSHAIDAGSNPLSASFDQREAPYVRDYGAAPDIGTFEVQPDLDRIFAGDFEPLIVCP